jgi:hypothetical protein
VLGTGFFLVTSLIQFKSQTLSVNASKSFFRVSQRKDNSSAQENNKPALNKQPSTIYALSVDRWRKDEVVSRRAITAPPPGWDQQHEQDNNQTSKYNSSLLFVHFESRSFAEIWIGSVLA